MKPLVLIGCALCLAGAASQALAQTPRTTRGATESQADRDREARHEFERGRKAYDEGDYRGAWSFFHNAYRLSGRAQLLFNIGQTADRLGHDSEALTAFRMYLERLPRADNRRDVENRIRALEERVADTGRAPPPPGSSLPTPETLPEVSQPTAATPDSGAIPDEPPSPPPTAADEGPRPTRSGFYLRVGLGLGVRRDGLSGGVEGTLSGVGFAGELAFGGTLFPGFVVGGGIYSDLASSPTFEGENGGDFDLGSAHLTMLGAFADWYLTPITHGFHVQAALTFAVLAVDYQTAGVALGRDAAGVGLMLGVGYEWPVAREWAVGALFRLSLASLSDELRSHGIFAPSLMATVTWY